MANIKRKPIKIGQPTLSERTLPVSGQHVKEHRAQKHAGTEAEQECQGFLRQLPQEWQEAAYQRYKDYRREIKCEGSHGGFATIVEANTG